MSAALQTLCDCARIQMRQEPSPDASFLIHLPTIRALLAMRKAGMLQAVWIDRLRDIHVLFAGNEFRQRLSWTQADDLADWFTRMPT